jgi:hypothetical protein
VETAGGVGSSLRITAENAPRTHEQISASSMRKPLVSIVGGMDTQCEERYGLIPDTSLFMFISSNLLIDDIPVLRQMHVSGLVKTFDSITMWSLPLYTWYNVLTGTGKHQFLSRGRLNDNTECTHVGKNTSFILSTFVIKPVYK